MSEIQFKATRRMHDSGFRMMDKSGDMEYDLADTDGDVLWITVTEPQSIKIDCQRDGTYRLMFDGKKAFIHNLPNNLTKGSVNDTIFNDEGCGICGDLGHTAFECPNPLDLTQGSV